MTYELRESQKMKTIGCLSVVFLFIYFMFIGPTQLGDQVLTENIGTLQLPAPSPTLPEKGNIVA